MQNKAAFLDRDGVINPLVYFKEEGSFDSPFSAKQFKFLPNVIKAVKLLNSLKYKVIVISNQPGIAKKKYDLRELNKINIKMLNILKKEHAVIDAVYYCLHHPEAINRKYKKKCKCRKPHPGLILRAAKKYNINLKKSFMIGDNISDIKAGNAAGCKTVFIGAYKCDHCRMFYKERVYPDFVASDLFQAAKIILKNKNIKHQKGNVKNS